jgi:signal transduction histidine kinase
MRRRILTYGTIVAATLFVTSFVAGRLFIDPHMAQLRFAVIRLAMEHILEGRSSEERFRRAEEVRQELNLNMSLFDHEGQLLVSNVEPPLDAEGCERNPARRCRHLVSMEVPQGHGLALEDRTLGLVSGFMVILGLTLLVLGLMSIPFARAMTRPLESLASAARRFGQGALSARAEVRGVAEIAETARAFNTMADQLAELRRSERELLANVSHELRTPMARMRVLLELLETNPTAAQRYVHELTVDLTDLEFLLDNIILTSRLELAADRLSDPYPTQFETLSLQPVLTDVAADFRDRVPTRVLSVELPGQAVNAKIDRTLFRRAVMNLLMNAEKYSSPASDIRLRLEPTGVVEVIDSGDGIAPPDVGRVFEPFFRADKSRTRGSGGVGLGLAFVQRVARLHGGTASVRSAVGEGSTFRIDLPVVTS